MTKPPTILITCGEASGDLHAAILVSELLKKVPDAKILALGGDKVAEAGAEVLFNVDDYAVIGISAVLTNLPRFLKLERNLKQVLTNGVDLHIPVDFPGLNIRLAAHAKQSGVPVLYYISPQVWAWGWGRVDKLARAVDHMAVILPFEEEIYRDHGIPVEFVGHPLVEDHPMPQPRDQQGRAGVGLLPGSRSQEVRHILPLLLDTAKHIRKRRPDERFVIGLSPSVPMSIYNKIIARHDVDVELDENTEEVMANSRLLLVASGTATLQGALFGTPMVIVYRVSLLTYMIARRLIKIDNIGLVNIILGEEVCPEFVQNAKPESIADKAISLLDDKGEREAMLSKFGTLRELLAGRGGCRRVAEISERLLNSG